MKLFNWDKPGFPPCGLLNCGNRFVFTILMICYNTISWIFGGLRATEDVDCVLACALYRLYMEKFSIIMNS